MAIRWVLYGVVGTEVEGLGLLREARLSVNRAAF
jgi:hypothetical protein